MLSLHMDAKDSNPDPHACTGHTLPTEVPILPAPTGCSVPGGNHYLVEKRGDLLFSPFPFFLPYFHDVVIKAQHMLSLLGVSTWDIKDGDEWSLLTAAYCPAEDMK